MHVWNVLHVARWKQGCKKVAKNRHLGTITQLCRAISSQLRHVSTIGKKLAKRQYVLHISPQYVELRPTSGWDRSGSLRHPCKFQRVSRLGSVSWQCYCTASSSRHQPNRGVDQRAPPMFGRETFTLGNIWPTFLVVWRILARNNTVKWLHDAGMEASACARIFSLRLRFSHQKPV